MKKLVAVLFLLGIYNTSFSASTFIDPCLNNSGDQSVNTLSVSNFCATGICTGEQCDLTSLNISQLTSTGLAFTTEADLTNIYQVISTNAQAQSSANNGTFDKIIFTPNDLEGFNNINSGFSTNYAANGNITISYNGNSYSIASTYTNIMTGATNSNQSVINNTDGTIIGINSPGVTNPNLATITLFIPFATNNSQAFSNTTTNAAPTFDKNGNINMTYTSTNYIIPSSNIISTWLAALANPGNATPTTIYNDDSTTSILEIDPAIPNSIIITSNSNIPCVTNFVSLAGATISNSYLPGIQLNGVDLTNTTFTNSCLQGANLKGIKGPDTSEASPQGVAFFFSNLNGADFTGANLNGAGLGLASLIGTNFTLAVLTNLVESFTTNAEDGTTATSDLGINSSIIQNTIFDGANMVGASLNYSNSVLLPGNFGGCSFKKTDFQNGSFSFFTASDSLNNVDFTGAGFNSVIFNNVDISSCKSYSNADFTNASFNGMIFWPENPSSALFSSDKNNNGIDNAVATSLQSTGINFNNAQFNQVQGIVLLLQFISGNNSPNSTTFQGTKFNSLGAGFNRQNMWTATSVAIDISNINFKGATFGSGPANGNLPANSQPLMFGAPGQNIAIKLPTFNGVTFNNVIFQAINGQLNAVGCVMNNFTVIGNSECSYANTTFACNPDDYTTNGSYWSGNGNFSIGGFVGNYCNNCSISYSMILNETPPGAAVSGMGDTTMAGNTYLVCNGFNLTSLVNSNITTSNKDFITRNYILAYCHTTGCRDSDPEIAASRAFHSTYDHYNTYRYYNPYTGKNGD